jgi:hypothetical protein
MDAQETIEVVVGEYGDCICLEWSGVASVGRATLFQTRLTRLEWVLAHSVCLCPRHFPFYS